MPGTPSPPTRDGTDSGISKLREYVRDWGMDILRSYEDDIGLYCLLLNTQRGPTYSITKAYQYRDLASFPDRVVKRASDNDYPMTVFFGDDPRIGNAYTFSPVLVSVKGERSVSNHGPQRREVWVDIPIENGVNFGDWITWREDLPCVSSRYY